MAKKVKRKLEEEAEPAFEFPAFDETAFVTKEFEMTGALALTATLTAVLGIVSWALSASGLSVWVPLGLGLLGVIASPFLIRRLRTRSAMYTKGDWAGLLALEFFGWLALWFVLLNLAPTL